MTKTQKIKSLIISLILVLIISSIGIFAYCINPKISNTLLDKGKIVTANNSMLVHFISVGQGDAIAINLPDGKIALIDAGLIDSNITYTNYLNDSVLNISKDKTIDYLILTHADTDHTGGALRLIQEFDVDNIILPALEGTSIYYEELTNKIKEKEILTTKPHEISEINGKNYKFEFFIGENSLSTNEMSHVVKLTGYDKSFLFAGDISSTIELQLIQKYGEVLDSDVLKVAHHGSKYSSSDEFLQIVTPKISVISCGENSYGHPTSEAISNILETGSSLYRTDTNGNIVICVGEHYNLKVICGNYKTIGMSFSIEILIVVVDFVILFDAITIFIKKEKRKQA